MEVLELYDLDGFALFSEGKIDMYFPHFLQF